MQRLIRFTLFIAIAVGAVLGWVWRRAVLRRLRLLIEARLGGYRQRPNVVDTLLPERTHGAKKVAVIGSGLAGIGAASTLAARGYEITLIDKNPYLGGKIGAWTHRFDDGVEQPVEHGFHAFFASYYNLNAFFERSGVARNMVPISDYLVVARDGTQHSFGDLETTPVLNLLDLARRGLFRVGELLDSDAIHHLGALLEYRKTETFQAYDHETFAAWSARTQLPPSLGLVFNTFSRAFFAHEDEMSMAELIRSFHFYYLSNDGGLIYSFPEDDYSATVLAPIREHLEELGVDIQLGAGAGKLKRAKTGGILVGRRRFDEVVLATDVRGAHALLSDAPLGEEAPQQVEALHTLRPRNRYAVLRLWLDRDLRPNLPAFTVVERIDALDSVTAVHRAERTSAAWVAEHGGSVIELHSYALPHDATDDADIQARLWKEAIHYFPELRGAQQHRSVLQVRDDFACFHAGLAQHRPDRSSGIEDLWFAGDWVDVPWPMMLMERAFTSGVHAANAILERDGVQQQQVYAVPSEGIMKPRARPLAAR